MASFVTRLRPHLPHIALILLSGGCVLLLFLQPVLWSWAMGPYHRNELNLYPFLDLMGRLAHMEAHAHGFDVYNQHNPLDPMMRKNGKPGFTLFLGKLGLGTQHRYIVGAFLVCIFLLLSWFLLRPRSWLEMLFALLVILAPPILFLIERCNDDIVIFILLAATPVLLTGNRYLGRVASLMLVFVAMAIKVYPAAAFAIFTRNGTSPRITWVFLAISGLSIATYLILNWAELSFLRGRFPSPDGICTFGAVSVFDAFGLQSIRNLGRWALFAIALGFAALVSFRFRPHLAPSSPVHEVSFVLGASLLSFCYFVHVNWDYRLVFVLFLMPFLFDQMRSPKRWHQAGAFGFVGVMLFSMWIEYLHFGLNYQHPDGWYLENKQPYSQMKQVASLVHMIGTLSIATVILRPSLTCLLRPVLRHCPPGAGSTSILP